jgi:hypothetical protein
METPPFRMRTATTADVDAVMKLCLESCEENAFLTPDPVHILQEVWPALERDHGIVGVIEGPKGLEGGVLLRVGKVWYSQEPVLEERAIFVGKEYRAAQGGRAKHLTDFSKKAADGLGIPLIIGVLSHSRTAAKVRLYERQFGAPAGAFFLYGAQTGGWRAAAAEKAA